MSIWDNVQGLFGWQLLRGSEGSLRTEQVIESEKAGVSAVFCGSAKPYVRWWWLAGPFNREDITFQLKWIASHGFGGIEIAWIWPLWIPDASPGIDWLGQEWSELAQFSKQEAERLGLGCDFTFGSCWPFGGSVVSSQYASQTFDGLSDQRLVCSWEQNSKQTLFVLNHLSGQALRRYAENMLKSLAPALEGSKSALFCDSLELHTRELWDNQLWERFEQRWGYRLRGEEQRLEYDQALRYDYRVIVAEAMYTEFFLEFAQICKNVGAYSRVQCHGAPTDLLAAYAAVDIPESEAILFEPSFSRIAASAAYLAGKGVVSAEAFTCIYGFPSPSNPVPKQLWRREQIGDLKLLADALFANGVNLIVWHGMPFNGPNGGNEFYASVHIGPDSPLAKDVVGFNDYLTRVSTVMRLGQTASQLAVYLPNEDNWRCDRIPENERTPGANYRYEMRHVVWPHELAGYAPLWISLPFLQRATVENQRLKVGTAEFEALLVDVNYLEGEALQQILRLASEGLRVVLPRRPEPPGLTTRSDYAELMEALFLCPCVFNSVSPLKLTPIVEGQNLPPFWTRRTANFLYLFFANPLAHDVHYPMPFCMSYAQDISLRKIRINAFGKQHRVTLCFEPHQSILLRISSTQVELIDVNYVVPDTDR